ncbi:MAG: T9SS type A sorting domain-containing protein [Bacteroidota bacterium]|nr:T9SS type A sorting domain-containing protein [Bacteroidota bacterium]
MAQLDYVFSNWGGPGWQIINGKFPASLSVNGQTFKFIVILPQFSSGASPSNVDQVITYLISHYQVDSNRIYLTGNSSGGGYCWDYPGASVQYGNRVAAVVPTCAAASYSYQKALNIAAANLPVWATHNAVDNTVSPNITRSFVNGINSVPSPPTPLAKMTIFQDVGHNCADSTFNTTYGLHIYNWMLQYSRASSTLSVSGLDLKASNKDDNKVELDWSTYSETNNRGFEVQRSDDGINFDPIGFIKSQAVSGSGARYTFTDPFPFNGKNYYRLLEVDFNNQAQLSTIEMIQLQKNIPVKVYPNPVNEVLTIYTGERLKNAKLKIINTAGQVVKDFTISGSASNTVSVRNLPAGVYSGQIKEETGVSKFSFVKY